MTWCRLCHTKRAIESQPCNATREPDVIEIADSWFAINSSIPAPELDLLWSLWDDATVESDIPAYLRQYETSVPPPGLETEI